MPSPLLSFQHTILTEIHDPSASSLLILARGLGLRKIVCSLLRICDSPQNLTLLVGATDEEQKDIGELLGVMGSRNPGLRVVDYEMGRKQRQMLYRNGGLVSVTSRILTVDMLQSDIPVELITGLVVLHAERVTSLSLEAFIIRLFREKNSAGFVKAFSDEPEHFTSGLYPLKAIMKELQVRKVHIYPRFHEEVKKSLERRRADVIELYQPLSESMADIHHAIVQCMSATLAELKRANSTLELDDLTVENAYFRSFDAIVRRQLDPIWHRVGPRTKQLVGDLATLRNLLNYLLSYDALAFHAYLETIIASNSTITLSGGVQVARQNRSLWLFTDAANIIFKTAKRRCYVSTTPAKSGPSKQDTRQVYDVDDDDAWSALNEAEVGSGTAVDLASSPKGSRAKLRKWLPDGMNPVLEELPKWSLLVDVLQEIEEELIRMDGIKSFSNPGTNTVLVMCSSQRTCDLLSDFLSVLDREKPRGEWGHRMMSKRLRFYLWWKARLNTTTGDNKATPQMAAGQTSNSSKSTTQDKGQNISDALKKKDAMRKERSMNRRRIRGGPPSGLSGSNDSRTGASNASSTSTVTGLESGMSTKEREKLGILTGEDEMRVEADSIHDFLASQKINLVSFDGEEDSKNFTTPSEADQFGRTSINVDEEIAASMASEAHNMVQDEDFYGLIAPQQTILFRAYSDDADDELLEDVRPRFIVMYEPNQDFIRRIECYRSSNPGLGVRVYFMMYQYSCEEHKYLAGLRREKDAFERLIKERGSMLIPILEDSRAGDVGENIIKTISTRIAGGKQINIEPSQVIVDMREFRSTLPSLLHAAKMLVIPATLTVGDYILTPDMCVERKSIPDLMQSLASGRLYTQCELMSVHYKQPILLIEFEEHKSFQLKAIAEDVKSYAKPSAKSLAKLTDPSSDSSTTISVQSKLVLLTLHFPRLRIVWSSSPYATADIFRDLKAHEPEPDATRAIAIGAEEDPEAGAGVNQAAEELLRALPGINAKNVKYVMSKVRSVTEFCALGLPEVQEILGNEPGKLCWEFMHQGE